MAKEEAKAAKGAKGAGEAKELDYKKLNAGTPHLPECTGMNGDRKGAGYGSECR